MGLWSFSFQSIGIVMSQGCLFLCASFCIRVQSQFESHSQISKKGLCILECLNLIVCHRFFLMQGVLLGWFRGKLSAKALNTKVKYFPGKYFIYYIYLWNSNFNFSHFSLPALVLKISWENKFFTSWPCQTVHRQYFISGHFVSVAQIYILFTQIKKI